MYAGISIDSDVDFSLLSEVDLKDKMGLNNSNGSNNNNNNNGKTEREKDRGSLLSTRSSSAYTSVNTTSATATAAREREDATVQSLESYTYGGKGDRGSKSKLSPLIPISARVSQQKEIGMGEKEKDEEVKVSVEGELVVKIVVEVENKEEPITNTEVEGDRHVPSPGPSPCLFSNPWEEDKHDNTQEGEEEDDPNIKYLLLTPANLGCMPPIEEEEQIERRPNTASIGMPAISSAKKCRDLDWMEEEKERDGITDKEKVRERDRERERERERDRERDRGSPRGLEDDPQGNAHFVKQYLHSSKQPVSFKGGPRHSGTGSLQHRASSNATPILGLGLGGVPVTTRSDLYKEGNSNRERERDRPASRSKSVEEAEGTATDNPVWDISNSLNYEAAGYRMDMNFSGANSMVADPYSVPNSVSHHRTDGRYQYGTDIGESPTMFLHKTR